MSLLLLFVRSRVEPTGIVPTSIVGTPTVAQNKLYLTGITPTSNVGTPYVRDGKIHPFGIAATTTFGTAKIAFTTAKPDGITSTANFGIARLAGRSVAIYPIAIPPISSVGTPSVINLRAIAYPTGIASTAIVSSTLFVIKVEPTTIRRPRRSKVNQSEYTFQLVRSRDMYPIWELEGASNRLLQLTLDKAGSFAFNLPLEGEVAASVSEASTGVLIYKRDVPVWSGAVWTLQEQSPNTLAVGCVGWKQTLEKRVSKIGWGNPLTYDKIDAGAISLDLLARTNKDADTGVPNYVFPGVAQTTQLRTRSYAPYVNILQEIDALSDIESGYDLDVHPLTRKMNMYAQLGTLKPNVRFEYRNNVNSFTRTSDATRMCNRMIAYSSVGAAIVEDVDSQHEYGLFEEAVSLSDVVDISILQAFASAEIAVRSTPLRITTFSPRPFVSTNDQDPQVFDDFNVGDVGFLTATKGRVNIDKQAVRLFSFSVGFNSDATETVTSIQTTAS